MIGKLLFYSGALTSAIIGLVLIFHGYAVPGAMAIGFGYCIFNVIQPTEV